MGNSNLNRNAYFFLILMQYDYVTFLWVSLIVPSPDYHITNTSLLHVIIRFIFSIAFSNAFKFSNNLLLNGKTFV
jgi:hypothetical protein